MATQLTRSLPDLASDLKSAHEYAAASRASNTRKAYRGQWQRFSRYAETVGAEALPASPGLVAAYLAHLAELGRRVPTLEQARAAIGEAHRAAGHSSPTDHSAVKQALAGMRRTRGAAPRRKRPLSADEVRWMADAAAEGRGSWGMRDRALLLVGFAGAFRCSELVALDVEDLTWDAKGVRVMIRRSKTDQQALGREVGLPYGRNGAGHCPVRALRVWLDAVGIDAGAIFRAIGPRGELGARLASGAVAETVQAAADAIGLDPSQVSAHSLRAGLVTEAARAGRTESQIMRQTGHRSSAIVRAYIRHANVWDCNPADGLY